MISICRKDTGATASLTAILTGLLIAGLTVPVSAVGLEAPRGMDVAGTELLVSLDPSQPASAIQKSLAEAGFQTVRPALGVPKRFGPMRLVTVPSVDEQTRAKLLAVPGVRAVRPVYSTTGASGRTQQILPTGQVVVKFVPGTTLDSVQNFAAQAGCTISRQIAGLPQTYVLDPSNPAADPQGIASKLQSTGQVVYSHASILLPMRPKQAAKIEDPLYPFQWHLHNTGQLSGAVPGADIKAPEAWETTMGEGAVVGVIDDCVQKDHEDLKDNYIIGYDYVDMDGDPSPAYGPDPYYRYGIYGMEDPIGEGHGTCVSGIICARANQVGLRGVAPMAGLVGCRLGITNLAQSADVDFAEAFLFCERSGAMVINNSWGPSPYYLPVVPTADVFFPNVVSDAIHEITTNGRGGLGVLVTFASGNESLPISYGNPYGTLPGVMSIGATMRNDVFACYSDYGPEQSVVAPGGGLAIPKDYDVFYYYNSQYVDCFESDIATTDVHEVPGVYPEDVDMDGLPDPSYPVRGINPPMKFLDAADPYFPCPTPSGFYDPTTGQQFIYLCWPLVPDLAIQDFPNQDYTHHMNGTSAATPVTTGVAALVFSVNANLTAEQVRNLIEHTAEKVQANNEVFDTVSGHNERYGHGRVNAYNAVQAAKAGHNWPTPVADVINISSQNLVQLFWANPINDCAGVLVVQAQGSLDWVPTDGQSYEVGDVVATSGTGYVTVVANDLLTTYVDNSVQGGANYEYAIFVRNAENYYSWGRRASFQSGSSSTDQPLASISASPNVGPGPLKVHFAGGGISKSRLMSYFWSFGDGTSATGPTVDHTYSRPGKYMATLTVTTASGQSAMASSQIVVTAGNNQPPTASISVQPSSGNAPLVTICQAHATDVDGTIVRYNWDFGDGSTGNGFVVEHVFLVPGTYGVALTVTDDAGGVATATQLVQVTGSAPTAAATDPPNALDSERTLPTLCGAGTTGALAASMLLLAMFARKRR